MSSPKMGRLIVVEGPENTGKTTLAQDITKSLLSTGIHCKYLSFPGREPNSLGQLVYRLHHHQSEFGISSISPAAQQTLHLAAHLDAIDNFIKPLLKEGTWITLDRYWWSMWAHGTASGVDSAMLESLVKIEQSAWGEITPTVLFCTDQATPFTEQVTEHWRNVRHTYQQLVARNEPTEHVELLSQNLSREDRTKAALKRISNISDVPLTP